MLFHQSKATELVWKESRNWINSQPLSLSPLQGKVVLLDFWTYSCVNCLRTLPALKEMWKKYADKGLIIIGIHTPEFEFEKDLTAVLQAVRRLGIEYPVLHDPTRVNWDNYGNTYWPRAALISPQGEVILDHVGESGYDEIEKAIVRELKKMKGFTMSNLPRLQEEKRYYHPGISPETYAGSARNNGLGSTQVCTKSGCNEYYDSGKYHSNIIYLQGDWRQTPEYLEFQGEKGYIIFQYYAQEVNVVMDGRGAATVVLNDKPVPAAAAGKEVQAKPEKSIVFVDRPDMYSIIRKGEVHTGVLKIMGFKWLKIYAYTFG